MASEVLASSLSVALSIPCEALSVFAVHLTLVVSVSLCGLCPSASLRQQTPLR